MKKLRKQAKELLHAANKVYHYRRDVIPESRLSELEQAVAEVATMLKDKETQAKPFEASQQRLDALLKKIGGKIYPKTFWSDNIEVVLVAAIIVIGIRTFFFQPFIIPTNSMYPTYSGMNAVVYENGETPSVPEKVFKFLTQGARHYRLEAQNSGEIEIPLRPTGRGATPYFDLVDGRKWFGILPAKFKSYVFLVGGVPHSIRVPAEFQLETVMEDALLKGNREARLASNGMQVVPTGIRVDAGDPVLEFDITLGDALFVDRISYHFRKPKVGDPFVFRTDDILEAVGEATGDYTPKYYIKRLVGVEGETLQIEDSALLVDGEPRDEVEAFERNATQEGEYSGYINQRLLAEGRTMTIPEKSFVALGDNSANSADSRYWGFVPEKSLIGKAIFIYYPFTKRWGVAE